MIGITVYIYSIRERVDDFAAYGYPGIFLIALLANATVFLPAPGVAVVFAMGSIFNPLGVALAASAGAAIGELSGYLAGFSGQFIVEKTTIYNGVAPWVKKYGVWAVLVLPPFQIRSLIWQGSRQVLLKSQFGNFCFSAGWGNS